MAISGQKTVTTAGTRVALGSGVVNGPLVIKAHPDNTGIIYVGDSSVSSSNGFTLKADQSIIIEECGHLENVYIDASANSQKVSFIQIKEI